MPMVEAAFDQANRVIFIAAASRVVFARLEHKNNFRYLPSWIDVTGIQQFAAAHTPTALREQYGYPREAIIFANIGSVCDRKGQHVFIQAIAQLQILLAATGQPLPPLQFLMVGARPGNYLEALRHEILRLGLNGVTSFSAAPLRAAAALGALTFLASLLLSGWVLWIRFSTEDAVPGWASTVIPVYFLGGLQLLCTGVLGEYLMRVFLEVKHRPRYVIEHTIGLGD